MAHGLLTQAMVRVRLESWKTERRACVTPGGLRICSEYGKFSGNFYHLFKFKFHFLFIIFGVGYRVANIGRLPQVLRICVWSGRSESEVQFPIKRSSLILCFVNSWFWWIQFLLLFAIPDRVRLASYVQENDKGFTNLMWSAVCDYLWILPDISKFKEDEKAGLG